MNDAPTGRASKASPHTDWKRVRNATDAEIHRGVVADRAAKPTDEDFWADARLVMPRRKEPVTMRLDADVLAWFRRERGYQTRINAVLRTFMQAQQRREQAVSRPRRSVGD